MAEVHIGPANLITDVAGISVGNAHCPKAWSGVSVVLPHERAVAACDVRGGAPGTRETDALDPSNLVEAVDAIVLSGGSVYGLDAVSGAVGWLGARGRGFRLGAAPLPSPVVPGAILFDLANGGDKSWGEEPPYRVLGREACEKAARTFALGNSGAGFGAVAGVVKGGLGSASATDGRINVGALVAVNSFGSVLIPGTRQFWAAPFEIDREFGGLGWPHAFPAATRDPLAESKLANGRPLPGGNTTIGLIATDLALTPAEARRIAVMAQDGLARAIRPVHAHVDGDTVFALSTGIHRVSDEERLPIMMRLGAMAADCMARAIARGIYSAERLGSIAAYPRDGE